MKDGTKIQLGFALENKEPVIKTEPEFLTPAKLTSKDAYALRYVAFKIIDQINQRFDPDAFSYCWCENDDDNFVCENMLNLNNGYGIRCENGDILEALYIAGENIMGSLISEDETVGEYRVLIS